MGKAIADIESHFWSKVKKGGASECWPYLGLLNTSRMNYGVFVIKRKTKRAHRVAYELTHGPIPLGKLVLHSCDNPPCCNPAHLSLGTHRDNARQRMERGRSNMQPAWKAPRNPNQKRFRGEASANAKLTARLVVYIRDLYACGINKADLARNFGVSWSLIKAIVTRKAWTHI